MSAMRGDWLCDNNITLIHFESFTDKHWALCFCIKIIFYVFTFVYKIMPTHCRKLSQCHQPFHENWSVCRVGRHWFCFFICTVGSVLFFVQNLGGNEFHQ